MSINIYPSIAKVKRNGVYENLPGFVQQSGNADIEAMIATKESDTLAQYPHPQGSYFILNDVLYQADIDIPVNGTIAVGTTCHVAVLADDVADNKNENKELASSIDDVKDLLGYAESEEIIINGYGDLNSATSSPPLSPFIPVNNKDFTNCLVNKIKLNILRTGTLSIGVIKKEDAVSGQPFDISKVNVKAILTITETGTQTVNVTPKFPVGNDEYLFVCLPTDTAIFYYGEHGPDKVFYYIQNNLVRYSTNSLGIDFDVLKTSAPSNIRETLASIYSGKTLSILGDSISTFAGYIPDGNATYYPAGTVTAVTDTWWKKLADALGMSINVNNSWSGSRVTTTAGETSAGCMTRCENLGTSPDVIIVWMGINDFNNEVALGTYDGKSTIPETTTTFREAYGIMLNKILTAYKTSEVWVCTLPQCERNGTSGFPEINSNDVALADFNIAIRELADSFGVKVLEHNKCGLTYQNMPVYNPDNLHPNKFGHSLVANNDIWQMDATISKRYPLA